MSEHDETPALTRRERRLQALGETGAMPTVDASAAGAEATAVAEAAEQHEAETHEADPAEEIEISPTDPDGRPRSRREIRELRDQARAAMEAEAAKDAAADAQPAAEETPEKDAPVEEAPVEAPHIVAEPSAEPTLETVAAEIIEPEVASSASEPAPATIVLDSIDVEAPAEAAEASTPSAPEAPVAEAAIAPEAPVSEAAAAPEAETPEPVVPEAEAPDLAATQAFSIAEIAEASGSWSEERAPETAGLDFDAMVGQATAQVAEEAAQAETTEVPDTDAAEPAAEEPAPAKSKKRKLGWKKKQAEVAEEETPDALDQLAPPAPAAAMPAADAAPAPTAAASASAAPTEPAPSAIQDAQPAPPVAAAQPTAVVPPAPEAPAAPEAEQTPAPDTAPAPQSARTGYSFPDIVPLDDGMSVFDDPAVHRARMGQTGSGDFEDLITRAVAQEGAVSTTNTSALILPSMPETGDLTGPLGATGDLFLTGSIELPKSLGETGGHAAMHDSIDVDAADEVSREAAPSDPHGAAPVSAARAVSARSAHSVAVVNENTRGTKTLPIILMSAGGVLLIGVVGLLIWGASNGMFG